MKGLANTAWQWAQRQTLATRLLAKRARFDDVRVPLIFVPSALGTRLVHANGHRVWGGSKQVLLGPPKDGTGEASTDGLLEQLPIIPGLLSYDVFGGLLHFLERVGGYTRGEDLFVLDYDWRASVADGALALSELVSRVQGCSDQVVDIVGVSSGGVVARYFLGQGDLPIQNNSQDRTPPEPDSTHAKVRRVVYLGVPQRGVLEAVMELEFGMKVASVGRRIPSQIMAQMQLPFDMLPHPADSIFVDPEGRTIDLDIYDAGVWRDLKLRCAESEGFEGRLAQAAGLQQSLEAMPAHPSVFAIAARHKTSPARIMLSEEGITWPCCLSPGDTHFEMLNHAGDGAIPEASLRALPGLDPDKIWWTTPREHRLIATDTKVHALVLEALLTTERDIRSDLYPLRPRVAP